MGLQDVDAIACDLFTPLSKTVVPSTLTRSTEARFAGSTDSFSSAPLLVPAIKLLSRRLG